MLYVRHFSKVSTSKSSQLPGSSYSPEIHIGVLSAGFPRGELHSHLPTSEEYYWDASSVAGRIKDLLTASIQFPMQIFNGFLILQIGVSYVIHARVKLMGSQLPMKFAKLLSLDCVGSWAATSIATPSSSAGSTQKKPPR